MGRLIIEILIVMLISSIAFVLGAIFGSSARRTDREEAITEELMNRAAEIEKFNSEVPNPKSAIG
jgi:type II secretory pathway pseudopilin PulG